MQNDGTFKFLKKINGGMNEQCMGIAYDYLKSVSTLLIYS